MPEVGLAAKLDQTKSTFGITVILDRHWPYHAKEKPPLFKLQLLGISSTSLKKNLKITNCQFGPSSLISGRFPAIVKRNKKKLNSLKVLVVQFHWFHNTASLVMTILPLQTTRSLVSKTVKLFKAKMSALLVYFCSIIGKRKVVPCFCEKTWSKWMSETLLRILLYNCFTHLLENFRVAIVTIITTNYTQQL